jgi:transposase
MQIHSIGIDLGKTTFHFVALGAAGKVLVRRKFTRSSSWPTQPTCRLH